MESTSRYTTAAEASTPLNIPDIDHQVWSKRPYGNITVDGNGFTVVGDAYFNTSSPNARIQQDEVAKLGLCFGSAPQLEPNLFVGRVAELEKMSRTLRPVQPKQQRLVLGGIGGIGKTQLAITYAERYQQDYDSIFWLNATSRATLNADLRLVAGRLLEISELERLVDEQVLARVHKWLSHSKNTRWLLVFDNHDEPTQYDISKYCPYAAHGAVMITTRLPDCVNLSSVKMHIQELATFEESLDLLCRRSERANVQADEYARRLVKRLSGLPLALATAGAYMSKTPSMSFREYLYAYEERWNIDPQRPLELQEYQDRTLFTTWDMSYARLETDDPQAAQLLKFLAYFDNQKVWYELLSTKKLKSHRKSRSSQKCVLENEISLREVVSDRVNFEGAMRTLMRYCFVEAQSVTKSYSMHNCVHDWTLASLNKTPDKVLYLYAFDCVAAGTGDCKDMRSLAELQYSQLAEHAARLAHPQFADQLRRDIELDRAVDMLWVSALLAEHSARTAAERMCLGLLARQEETLGSDNVETLRTLNHLGFIYRRQGQLDKAEVMYARALAGREKVLGSDQPSTLNTIQNLGTVYLHQGKLDKAEKMYKLALLKMKKASAFHSSLSMAVISNLARVYYCQGKLEESEEMYKRVLAEEGNSQEYSLPESSTPASNVGDIYYHQGRLDEAEKMYKQALTREMRILGPNHRSTLSTVLHLAELYRAQRKLNEAEEMYVQLLTALQSRRSTNSTWVLEAKSCLAILYFEQGRPEEAQSLFRRVCKAYERIPESTENLHFSDWLGLLHNLSVLYEKQDRLEEAENAYRRAIDAHTQGLGTRHPKTQKVTKGLSELLRRQGREEELVELYQSSMKLNRSRIEPDQSNVNPDPPDVKPGSSDTTSGPVFSIFEESRSITPSSTQSPFRRRFLSSIHKIWGTRSPPSTSEVSRSSQVK